MVQLRAHHLICLLFFEGQEHGYNESFKRAVNEAMKRWETKPAEIVWGADDVCKRCPGWKNEKCIYYNYEEDILGGDEHALELLDLKVGNRVEKSFVKKQIPKVLRIWKKEHCSDCPWKKYCEREQVNFTNS